MKLGDLTGNKKVFSRLRGLQFSRTLSLSAGLLLLALIISLSLNTQETEEQKKNIPVRVLTVSEEVLPLELEYQGTVTAGEIKKLGFKMAGRLGKVYVEKGCPVLPGDLLASIDSSELQNAAAAAENTSFKAWRSFEYARDNYAKLVRLKEAGAISTQELDKALLELDTQEVNYKNADLDYQNKLLLLNESRLEANMAGYAADILYKQGEMVPAGSPVIILRSERLIIQTGLSRQDTERVRPGQAARIQIDGRQTEGSVLRLAQLPEQQIRTYLTEVEVRGQDFSLGANARVFIRIGEERGVFLPITCILNDGTDYVFMVNEDLTASKRKVVLGNIRETRVRAEGLQAGDRVVVEGMKRLTPGDRMTINP